MKLGTLIALLLPANAFWSSDDSNGLIEMDMHITHRPKKHLSNLGQHLMNLRSS
jgi:hypothetical protein